jgi:hypothetical protein
MSQDSNDEFVNRQKRKHTKKTNWGEKSDKVSHGKRTAHKRRLAEFEEDDDEWQEYTA